MRGISAVFLITVMILSLSITPASAETQFSIAITDVDFTPEISYNENFPYAGNFELSIEYWNPSPDTQYLLYISEYVPDAVLEFSLENSSYTVIESYIVMNWIVTKPFEAGITRVEQQQFIYHNNTNSELPPPGNYTFTPWTHCIVEKDQVVSTCEDQDLVADSLGYTILISDTSIEFIPPQLDEDWGSTSDNNSLPSIGIPFVAMLLVTIPVLSKIRKRE